eukprot:UN00564
MPLKTKFTEIFGVEHPIMCGGMHYVGYAELAAAVSNAGGLGIITALTQPTPELLREEIRKCKKLTNKPFGVNITLLPALKPPNYGEYIRIVIEEGIKIVETAGRNPSDVIKVLKAHNVKVIHKCVSIKHALTAERLGVDCISMDGIDAGGHPGENFISNYILLAQCKEQLKIPYIASGGIANGTQLAASLAFGACGVNCATRFIACKEANVHDNIKQALVKGDETSTQLVLGTVKNTERVFRNSASKKVAEIEAAQPGNLQAIIPYVKGENYRKAFQETGDTETGVWSCGSSIALIHDVPTCAEIIKKMVQECEESLQQAMKNVVPSSPVAKL